MVRRLSTTSSPGPASRLLTPARRWQRPILVDLSGFRPASRLGAGARRLPGKPSVGNCRRVGVGVAEVVRADVVGIGSYRSFRAGVDLAAIGIDRRAGHGITRVSPHDVGGIRSRDDPDVVAEKLLLQIVVAGAIGIRGPRTHSYWRAVTQSLKRQLDQVVVIDLDTRLPGVIGGRCR